MRISTHIQTQITQYARWHDAPRWLVWVELVCVHADGSQTWSGCPAAWLPWNQRKIKKKEKNENE